jgi:hypothetical protein
MKNNNNNIVIKMSKIAKSKLIINNKIHKMNYNVKCLQNVESN